jgi:hypothetical protein
LHDEPQESLEIRGPAGTRCLLQHEELVERQQPQELGDEAAQIENTEGPTHKISTQIAEASAPPRRRNPEKLGVCESALCTGSSNVPGGYGKGPGELLNCRPHSRV